MTTYERVRVQPESGPAFTVILRDSAVRKTRVLGSILTGVEVNREADEVASRGADERIRFISLDLVTKRTPLTMDRFTGMLTEPGEHLSEER